MNREHEAIFSMKPFFNTEWTYFVYTKSVLFILQRISCVHAILAANILLSTATSCPHCSGPKPSVRTTIALGILLGVGSVGCGDKDDDTSADDMSTVEEPASEPDMAAEYGVPSE